MSEGLPGMPGEAGSYGHGGTGGAGGRGGDPSGSGGGGGAGGHGASARIGGIWGRAAPILVGLAMVVVLVMSVGIGYLTIETYRGNTPAHQAAAAAKAAAATAATQSQQNAVLIRGLKKTVTCEKNAFNQLLDELDKKVPLTAPPNC